MVEMNFDIGGRAMMSFGGLYIGGGNRLQQEASRNDTPISCSPTGRCRKAMGRFSDRTLVRTYADNNLDLFDWLKAWRQMGRLSRPAGPSRPRPYAAQRRAVAE
jgi:hypothetical protein